MPVNMEPSKIIRVPSYSEAFEFIWIGQKKHLDALIATQKKPELFTR